MNKKDPKFFYLFFTFFIASLFCGSASVIPQSQHQSLELPVEPVGHPGEAVEAYFSPDDERLICNLQQEGDDAKKVYTMRTDGTDLVRVNDRPGRDTCTFYNPNGKKIVWTSSMDNPGLPDGDFHDQSEMPRGMELYISDLYGSNVKRLTNNLLYEAEVSFSPDGEWILFTRQNEKGELDLWRMKILKDGRKKEIQITKTPDLQEGGSFFMPDGKTIIFRAWDRRDEQSAKKEGESGQRGKKRSYPMHIYTVKYDGTGLTQITEGNGLNWSPYPAPDGRHFVFVRFLPPSNWEIFLMDSETREQTRLTYDDAFDGFPSISNDGRTMAFTSSRKIPGQEGDAGEGSRPKLHLWKMDISSLNIGPKN